MRRNAMITLFTSVMLLKGIPSFAALNGDYMNKVELRLATPHEEWGNPCARGRLKVLFITSLVGAPRDVVELAQRFDMDWTVFIVTGNQFGHKPMVGKDDQYGALVEGVSTAAKTAELLAKLQSRYDVIVLGNIEPERLPAECQAKLREAVLQGTGLVRFCYMSGGPKLLDDAKPKDGGTAQPAAPLQQFSVPPSVITALPYAGLRDFQQRAAGYRRWSTEKPVPIDEMAAKTVKAAQYGKGRVIGFWYEESATDSYSYRSKMALAPGSPDDLNIPIQYDYHLRAAAEAILWAGGRDSRFAVAFARPEGFTIARGETKGMAEAFTVTPANGAPAEFKVTARLRDELGSLLIEKTFDGKQAPLTAELVLPQLGAGTHYIETIIDSASGKEGWAARSFQVTDPRAATALKVVPRGFPAGEPVKASITFAAAPGAGIQAEALVLDAFDRVAVRQVLPIAPDKTEQSIEVPYPYPVGVGNTLLVTLTDGSGPVGRIWTDFFTQRKDEYERFPSVLWGCGGGTYLDRLLYRNLRSAFFTSLLGGTVVNRCDFTAVPTAANFRLHADPQGWTRNWLMSDKVYDPKAGDASIHNPAIRAEVERQMQAAVGKHGDKGVFVYNLGDENGFSYDGGAGPCEVVAFRAFLQKRYGGDLGLLNTCWGTGYAGWPDVVPMPNAEAIQRRRAAPYLDRCAFNEEAYAALHDYAADAIRKLAPGAKVGAEGSEPGDLERSVAHLDMWSPYEDLLSAYLQRAVQPKRLVAGNWWGGYVGAYGRPRNPVDGGAVLWRQLLRGTDNSSWFFQLDGLEGLINPDLSYADYFEKGLLPAIKEIGDGIGQQVNELPLLESDVYVYYSHSSALASKVIGLFGDTEQSVQGALASLEEIGLTPRIITARQVAEGRLDPGKVKLLIMPGVRCMSEPEAKAIAGYVKAGGRVVADIAPGVLGTHGEFLPGGRLDELFGVTRADLGMAVGPNLQAELSDHAPNDTGAKRNAYALGCQQPLRDWFTLAYVVDRPAHTWQLRRNGEQKGSADIAALESVSSAEPLGLGFNPGTVGFGGGGYDGAFFPWKGEIAELLIYRSASASERSAVESYLAGKYKLAAASPGAPVDPPPGAVLWLKADALPLNDGEPVTEWTDASGRHHDATAVSATRRPLFKKNGLGGHPTVVFPGTEKLCGPGDADKIKGKEGISAFEIANHADLQFGTNSFAVYAVARCDWAWNPGSIQPPTFLLGNQMMKWDRGGGNQKTLKIFVQDSKPARIPLDIDGFRAAAAITDPSVTPKPGAASQGQANQPLMIANRFGQGKTLLLNFDIGSAWHSMAPERANDWRGWWRTQTQVAGVVPRDALEGTPGRVTRFAAPGLTLVGISQPKKDTNTTATLRFLDGPYAVYDVVVGRYVGATNAVTFNPGERATRLYALLPEPAPRLQMTAKGCACGGTIAGTVALGKKPPEGQRRVVRLSTTDALGHDRLDLRRYPRAVSDKIEFAIPVAFNDAPGEWTVTATDVVTGNRASSKVTVTPATVAVPFPGPWKTDVGEWADPGDRVPR